MTHAIDRITLPSGLELSRIVTGLWQMADQERDGRAFDLDAAAEALAQYARDGFTTFDMADHYGSAEIVAGRAARILAAEGAPAPTILTKWCLDQRGDGGHEECRPRPVPRQPVEDPRHARAAPVFAPSETAHGGTPGPHLERLVVAIKGQRQRRPRPPGPRRAQPAAGADPVHPFAPVILGPVIGSPLAHARRTLPKKSRARSLSGASKIASGGPVSTTRPASMNTTLDETSRTKDIS